MRKKWLRMSKSHKEYFGYTHWGDSEEDAERIFLQHMWGKFSRSLPIKDLDDLPSAIRQRVLDLKPEEFGYNAWDLFI
jgi:hypothetical protein